MRLKTILGYPSKAAAILVVVALSFGASLPAVAGSVYEPARGSQERKDLMSAVRPVIEFRLGAPVQFVVNSLQSDGTAAFAQLSPQRPGGAAIDMHATPLVEVFGDDADYYIETGGTEVIALLKRSGTQWVVVDWSMGATDAWFSLPYYCDFFGAVLGPYCALE